MQDPISVINGAGVRGSFS